MRSSSSPRRRTVQSARVLRAAGHDGGEVRRRYWRSRCRMRRSAAARISSSNRRFGFDAAPSARSMASCARIRRPVTGSNGVDDARDRPRYRNHRSRSRPRAIASSRSAASNSATAFRPARSFIATSIPQRDMPAEAVRGAWPVARVPDRQAAVRRGRRGVSRFHRRRASSSFTTPNSTSRFLNAELQRVGRVHDRP